MVFADRIETTRTGFLMVKRRRIFPLAQLAGLTTKGGSITLITQGGEKHNFLIGRKAEEVAASIRAALAAREGAGPGVFPGGRP